MKPGMMQPGEMQDRGEEGQEGCRTGVMQPGEMQERGEAGLEGCRTGHGHVHGSGHGLQDMDTYMNKDMDCRIWMAGHGL